ncbi:MAG: PD-(D/E)XK nuclease family protein [Cyanobacteria bacterium J06621_8]
MSELDLVRLSQSHLNLLSICPHKFQRVYMDGLGTILAPEQHESMQWGSRFHLLMQQRELTLPIAPLLSSDSELADALGALITAAPELATADDAWREAEHCRTWNFDNFLLTVIYDLLIAQPERAVILDWKTYRQPVGKKKLHRNWQTRLYLYVLCQTSDYVPEQLQMTYWFVKSGKPTSVTIKYTQAEHQQTQQDLKTLLADLKLWLQNYRDFKIDFPQQSHHQKTVSHSQDFAQAESAPDADLKLLRSIDEIEEVSI